MSPTLFSIYLNDLAIELKESGILMDIDNIIKENPKNSGKSTGNLSLSINVLLYADDLVLLAKNETDLQGLLFIVEEWCRKWRIEVNLTKTNIMHVRYSRKPKSNYSFIFNKRPVSYCTIYKYLGFSINENIDFSSSNKVLLDSAGRALSVIITKMIKNKGFPYNVYSILVDSCVNSICDYGGEVTGFSSYICKKQLFLRAARAFLGLPKSSPTAAISLEIDWLEPKFRTQLKMIRQYNRVMLMSDNRLT